VTPPTNDEVDLPEDGHALSAAVPQGPEDRQVFRLAQLTVLLEVAGEENTVMRTVDRLGFYDFFSANPFVVVSGDDKRDVTDRLTLRLAGFSSRQLSYASTGQRFVSRRRRLQHDLALLIAYRIASIDETGYTLTPSGRDLSARLSSVYAESYRDAARVVLRRLRRLSDRQLRQQADEWLGRSWLLIDVLDDVAETTPSGRGVRRDGP
jgi:hypothetical protein